MVTKKIVFDEAGVSGTERHDRPILVTLSEDDIPFELVYADPKSIEANPDNWRTHGKVQMAEFSELYDSVGWAGVLLYNRETGSLCDGELRLRFALEKKLPFVPVIWGYWTKEQEDRIILMFNPVGEMAGFDRNRLSVLIDRAADSRTELISNLLSRVGLGGPTNVAKAETSGASRSAPDIVPDMDLKPFESYDYVMVMCTTTSQWVRLCEALGLERVRKPGTTKIGLNRVISADQLLQLIGG